MRRMDLIRLAAIFLVLSPFSRAATVEIAASRDATLIENPDGAFANGSGPYFFAGRTNQQSDSVRRAVIGFDVAAAVPADAVVTEVRLTLFLAPSNPDPRRISLRRLTADWGEGPSSSSGGGGAPSEPGDVTWLHKFYDQDFWDVSGGDFVGRVSARQIVDESGFVTWTSTKAMVQDVRLWIQAPSRNFGWILIGDESIRQTAKGFASRENSDPDLRPVLSVTYSSRGGAPSSAPTVSTEAP